jgi:hypothetical protein
LISGETDFDGFAEDGVDFAPLIDNPEGPA